MSPRLCTGDHHGKQKTMHALDVVTVPAAEGKQLTCFGESETG